MIAALFVQPDGCYSGTPGIDAWPESRDARTYAGPHPIVAHPPCNLWVNYAAVNWKRYKRQRPAWYPGGSDGGCFAAALAAVRKFGGVLEHPAFTHAWSAFALPRPEFGRWLQVSVRSWTTEVWQSAYGHKCRKSTWLLYEGDRPPFDLRWDRMPGTHQIGWFDRNKPTVSKHEASATPIAFRDELLRLARHSRGVR